MNIILKSLIKKTLIFLTIFLLLIGLFVYVNNILMKKLESTIQERQNLMHQLNLQSKNQILISKVKSKISEIEKKYNINFQEFKSKISSQLNVPDEEVKNKILSLAKEANINIQEETIQNPTPKTLNFSLSGSFEDLKKFESILIKNHLKAKIQSVRIFKQNDNYLFKLEILLF